MNESWEEKRPVKSWTKSTTRNENASPQYTYKKIFPSEERSFKRVSSGELLLLLGFLPKPVNIYWRLSVRPTRQQPTS